MIRGWNICSSWGLWTNKHNWGGHHLVCMPYMVTFTLNKNPKNVMGLSSMVDVPLRAIATFATSYPKSSLMGQVSHLYLLKGHEVTPIIHRMRPTSPRLRLPTIAPPVPKAAWLCPDCKARSGPTDTYGQWDETCNCWVKTITETLRCS